MSEGKLWVRKLTIAISAGLLLGVSVGWSIASQNEFLGLGIYLIVGGMVGSILSLLLLLAEAGLARFFQVERRSVSGRVFLFAGSGAIVGFLALMLFSEGLAMMLFVGVEGALFGGFLGAVFGFTVWLLVDRARPIDSH
jgi:hypothetical protein